LIVGRVCSADCPKANAGLVVLLVIVMWLIVLLLHASSQVTTGAVLPVCSLRSLSS
jgi:hypothetical protein